MINVMRCPICNNDTTKKYLDVLQCLQCTHIFTENVYDKEYWDDLYDNMYTTESRKFDIERNVMYSQEVLWMNKYKKLQGSFLDVGCSFGNFFLFLPKEMNKVGLEVSHKVIEEAKKIHPDSEFHNTQLCDFKTRTKFDFIQFRGVLQHSIDPVSNLKCAIPLLEKNGIIVATSLPDFSSLVSRFYKEKFGFYVPKLSPHFFTKNSFTYMIKSLNLQIISEESPYFLTPYANFPKDLFSFFTNKLFNKNNPPFYGNVKNYLIKINTNQVS